ncbi:GTP-binding protein [Maritalea sp. S77]|uniref:GTP-binding protein n=1 Tax=Maritalea sp. S77 TaxID=3415125 RepID=UPI003C7C2F91
MRTLNLGILAHIDAGKTSLTERLLFEAGIIHNIGSVDRGDTHTDSLELERQRGITIKSAVVSFEIADLTVNLIDTPGHPDFIAEVERILGLLDGAILVISAVEGIQPQTRILMRALKRLGVPTLIFINKIDRMGANSALIVDDLASQLDVHPVKLGRVENEATKSASFIPNDFEDKSVRESLVEQLAEHDEELLFNYINDPDSISPRNLVDNLAVQTAKGRVTPVIMGSAVTGAGSNAIQNAIYTYLPSKANCSERPLSGTIFKIDRGWGGERIAYAAIHAGSIENRDEITLPNGTAQVKNIQLFDKGEVRKSQYVSAGRIAILHGLKNTKIGDHIGEKLTNGKSHQFAPPTLETRITPIKTADASKLWFTLSELANQDPLINLRKDDENSLFVSLYGEVQKEVLQRQIFDEANVEVSFEESTVICIERIAHPSEVVMTSDQPENPFNATLGLRIEPRRAGTGNQISMEADKGQMPAGFYRTIENSIETCLTQGYFGWSVIDLEITITKTGWISPITTAADFRGLTPIVLAQAIIQSKSIVCEPINQFRLELPNSSVGQFMPELAKARAEIANTYAASAKTILEGTISASNTQQIQKILPNLSGGEGVLEFSFSYHAPISGNPPTRKHSGLNPFDRDEYLRKIRLGITN